MQEVEGGRIGRGRVSLVKRLKGVICDGLHVCCMQCLYLGVGDSLYDTTIPNIEIKEII
jgi:hypothetical protein